jgi:tight adherence protein C
LTTTIGSPGWLDLGRLLAAIGTAILGYCAVRCLTGPPGSVQRLRNLVDGGGEGRDGREPSFAGGRSAAGEAGADSTTRHLSRWLGLVRHLVPQSWLAALLRVWPAAAEAEPGIGTGLRPLEVHLAGLVGGLGLMLVLVLMNLAGIRAPSLVFGLVVAAAALLPRLWLGRALARHRAAVSGELPKVAELLTLGTESGLGLLEAMRLAGGLSGGGVGRALQAALTEIDAGRETHAALRDIASRVGGQEIATFVGSVVQGLALGVPVARVLRTQADTLRSRHRQALEARIAGLSMRLTVVTILLFVPALFVLSVLPNLVAFLRGQW